MNTSNTGKEETTELWMLIATVFFALNSSFIREKIPLSAPIKKWPSNSIAKWMFSGVSSDSTPMICILPFGKAVNAFFRI